MNNLHLSISQQQEDSDELSSFRLLTKLHLLEEIFLISKFSSKLNFTSLLSKLISLMLFSRAQDSAKPETLKY